MSEVRLGTKRPDPKAHRSEIDEADSSAIAMIVEHLENVGGDVERYMAGYLVEAATIEWPFVNEDIAEGLERQHAEITRTITATLDAIEVGDGKRVVIGSKAIETAGRRLSKSGLLSGLLVSVPKYTRLVSNAYTKPAVTELRGIAKDADHAYDLIAGLRNVFEDAAEPS